MAQAKCNAITSSASIPKVELSGNETIISLDASQETVHTNTKEANKEKKIGCFARICQFFSCKKRRQKKIEKYNLLFNEYLSAKETLCTHEAFMAKRAEEYKVAKKSAMDAGNKAELLALHKEKRKEFCALQAAFNKYLQAYKDILVQLNKLDPKKHPLSSKEKQPFNLLVFLRIKKVKKPVLNKYEQRHGKKILEAFKSHSEKLRAQQADELGIKKIIYEDREKGGKKHLFFHQNKPIGYINFEKDKFEQTKPQAALPQYKIVKYKNPNSLFFSYKSPFTHHGKTPSESKNIQLCRDANSRNSYFKNTKHMYSAYYVKHDDHIGMIARSAGDINGADLIKNEIPIPVAAFKKPLEELEALMKRNIYITDIKPDNMMIRKDANGEYQVNFIDIDTNIFDLSRKQTQDEIDYLYTFATTGYGEYKAHRIETERHLGSLRDARRLAKSKNYYAFLLSMYRLTKERNPKEKFHPFNEWCENAVLPQYQSKLDDFITYYEYEDRSIHNLSKMINWNYVAKNYNQSETL